MAAQKGAHLTLSLYAGVHSEADALYLSLIHIFTLLVLKSSKRWVNYDL